MLYQYSDYFFSLMFHTAMLIHRPCPAEPQRLTIDTAWEEKISETANKGKYLTLQVKLFTMNNSVCDKEHRYLENLRDLPENQKTDEGRHKCAGCAYEKGLEDGISGLPRHINLDDLPFSQAGTVRHKSPQAGYDLGYEEGTLTRTNNRLR